MQNNKLYPIVESVKHCRKCDVELTDDTWLPSSKKAGYYMCVVCIRLQNKQRRNNDPTYNETHRKESELYRKRHPDRSKECRIKCSRNRGHRPLSEAKETPMYLGVYIAERVLKNVFENVLAMPVGNPGFDFICQNGFKIDVKSACPRKRKNSVSWEFIIRRNKIAEFFLCLAFDSRDDLNPLHMWLLPGDKFNHMSSVSINQNTIDKWDEYRLPVDKVITCCNIMKDNA